ncbi:hypothetical protein WK09_29000 [Burkholderia ubonensis]|uniref:hypothetical protein n=1 Tax=Burkholderia ubonensis TaxID=101571 RepID=UPI00075640F3|nr:hypothetical protein [Burkholderia ubonensis]KVR04724.1 hypothetical protein WK09_29000 [Burkholderia ubonensis]KVW21487.1 hypothetical protein WK94_16825 [Burkholderia ubonensis]KWC04203.1 hypothetical protein WL43_19440 [Burkholderia ubonensis]KWO16328.1 hypothetical protein WM27_24650 [Burkholderia ubonensis]ODQ36910.1 hypothetical protein BGV65_04050 [Burkholderia ubonensis]
MKDACLFKTSAELRDMMQSLERRDNGVAYELLRRIQAQRTEAAALTKFGRNLNHKGYAVALEMLAMVPSGFRSSDLLARLLLELENDFVKASAQERRSRSAMRFDPFWAEFDALAKRHTHRDAAGVYRAIVSSGIATPHPTLRRAKEHYKELMEGNSQRLQIVGAISGGAA